MSKSLTRLAIAGALTVLAVSGCDCNGGKKPSARGEFRIVYTDNGVSMQGESGTYDFGTVSMGTTSPVVKVTVQNVGRGSLTINTMEKVSGSAVKVGAVINEENPVFQVTFDDSTEITLATGETREFDAVFSPPQDPTLKSVDHETVLLIRGGNTDPEKSTAQVTLKGKAVSGECEIPKVIDFGAVARGDQLDYAIAFKNTRPIDATGVAGTITSSQGETVFTYTAESSRGNFNIIPGQEKTVTVRFKPTEIRDYFATVKMQRAQDCPEVSVRLKGSGVDQCLTWKANPSNDQTMSTLDFGYVSPGLLVPGEIEFSNVCFRPVKMSSLSAVEGSTPSAVFKITDGDPGDISKLTVPAGARNADGISIVAGKATAKLSFKPIMLGAKTGQFRAVTDSASQPNVTVPIRGVGGGPDIDVRPAPLNFGRVAYFASATPKSFAQRRMTIINAGTMPTPPDPRANLRLGMGGVQKPFWTVTAKNANTSVDELCVGVYDTGTDTCTNDLPTSGPGAYDPNVGITANGANALLDVPVRVTPNSAMMKEWEITIYSNDPDEPEFKVTVQANVVVLPPCNATVTPLSLAFGVVSPPSVKDLAFKVKNNSSNTGDICLLSGLDIGVGSDSMFSLPMGAVAEKELQPGEEYLVPVRAYPQGTLPPNPTLKTGSVGFSLSDPMNPQRSVALSATLAPSCLTVSPSELDFGTVQKDCSSPDRTFNVYNTCTSPITVVSSSMAAAAGTPPMTLPECPGASPCPEFFALSTIPNNTVIPAGGAMPLTFRLKYRPINYGPDTGAFLMKVTQNGQMVDYLITLKGAGDTMGLNTDTFRQDTKPKADLLLVVDDSCSMSDKQMSLAANFGSFIQYATTNQVDFHIALTTTDDDTNNGAFKATPAGNKILTPTTPNLASEFAALVNVGINGSGTESCMGPAVEALTSPLITTTNANFLRPDAVLAVICVTDAIDQATSPVAFYLNQLMNVKGAQRASQFTYNVIGPFLPQAPSMCSYDSGQPDDGKHTALVTATNGVKEEICTPNWGTALENISKVGFGFRTNFFLTARPDLMSSLGIKVQIDGVDLPAVEPTRMTRVWDYDAVNNSVNFEPLYVPEPGKTMTITYQVACIP